MKIASLFLLGSSPNFTGGNEAEQEAKSDEMLNRLGLSKELKFLVRKEEEILQINLYGIDCFVILPYCNKD
ncbi:MAG: hypothetical protein QMD20_02760 [Candidatus Bathyarchaeia archaeon]|nr:hypothetical protein [Candidatus Bathyarchaeia archaeon]